MNLIGRRFNHWKVLKLGEHKQSNQYWICLCDCGAKKSVCQRHMLEGRSKSCYKCSAKRKSKMAEQNNRSKSGKTLYSPESRLPWMKKARKQQHKKQKGICPVCLKRLPKDSCFDHDHNTGECRELVHRGCNVFIGFVERDPSILSRVKAYLRRHGWRTNSK